MRITTNEFVWLRVKERKFMFNVENLPCEGGEVLAQVAQRSIVNKVSESFISAPFFFRKFRFGFQSATFSAGCHLCPPFSPAFLCLLFFPPSVPLFLWQFPAKDPLLIFVFPQSRR